MKNLYLKFFFAFIVFLLVPNVVMAQAPTLLQAPTQSLQVEGLAIDPFIIEVDAEPGQTITKTIALTNTTNAPLTFNASINDFVPNGKTGQPIFLDSAQESDPKYSISRWINIIQQPQFTIPPQDHTEVTFSITIPSDAESGSHYGGILFGRPIGEILNSGSAVQHKAGAIILVRLGQSQEKVQITNFSSRQAVYQHGPIEFLTSINNFGNVHAKPKGDITIRNIWGVAVTQVPVNPDALIVLPEAERDFISQWKNKLGFGRYTAEAILYYGSPKLELRAQTSFWIIPVKEIVIAVFILLILSLVSYFGIRRYNRYVITHPKKFQ
jgi:uncharacterized repeat protein (TIGR01451 family)